MIENEIVVDGKSIKYNLTVKNVKNINLKIKPCGGIFVSANKNVPIKIIEDFIVSRSEFIDKAVLEYEHRKDCAKTQYFTEGEIKGVILDICKEVYPYFQKRGIPFPVIKFRKMLSRWGSCHSVKGILTFNTNLIYAPIECIKYVVLHEFTHFLQPNHSEKFYDELVKVSPDWKEWRNKLKSINIR